MNGKAYFSSWLAFFALWWIVLIPIEFNIGQPVLNILHFPFYRFTEWLAGTANFQSDSYGMYALLITAVILASASAVIFRPATDKAEKLSQFSLKLVTYYLALVLLKYGWIKIIGLQFYLPEPNIVYRNFGFLSKDIAWWSLVGTSQVYSVTTGIIEMIAAIMLFIPRTRFAGALLSIAIFANVLLINISFDISVKLFSASLLLFALLIAASYPHILRTVFQMKPIEKTSAKHVSFRGKNLIKALTIFFILMESFYPGFTHDSNVPRNKFHGAYNISGSRVLSKIYAHRQDFLIIEDHASNQADYKMKWTGSDNFILSDPRNSKIFNGFWKENKLWINGITTDTLTINRLPYRSLPLFREEIHFFSDQFH